MKYKIPNSDESAEINANNVHKQVIYTVMYRLKIRLKLKFKLNKQSQKKKKLKMDIG